MADAWVTAEQILDSAETLLPGAQLACKLTGYAPICAVSKVLERVASWDGETRAKVADWLRWIPLVGAMEDVALVEPELPVEAADIREELESFRTTYRSSDATKNDSE